jgi:predicted MFS family arabinose efflux permease
LEGFHESLFFTSRAVLAMRWLAGFVLHKLAFGLLSVLVPLYITQTVSGGSLTVWGIIAASAAFVAIPFSFFWGFVCDATRRYRFFILLSFAAVTLLLHLFSLNTEVALLGILYTSIVVFQVAHEPSTNVLIAETYSHEAWKHAFASYEAWTELGWVIGLSLGCALFSIGLGISTLLTVSVLLSLSSFVASAAFVADPAMVLERSLVSMERSVSLVHRGAMLLSRENPSSLAADELKRENAAALCIGLISFSLATSMFFTPFPVFLAADLAVQTGTVFLFFLFNSVCCLIGYILVANRAEELDAYTSARRIAWHRGLIVLLPALAPFTPVPVALALSVTALAAMGFIYASYSVSVISISMEVIPQGRAGSFSALIGAGTAIGCLAGPLIADHVGFTATFTASATWFLLSYVAFRKFTRENSP